MVFKFDKQLIGHNVKKYIFRLCVAQKFAQGENFKDSFPLKITVFKI